MLQLRAASEGQAARAVWLLFNLPSEGAPSSSSSVPVCQSGITLSGSFAAGSNPPEPDPLFSSSSPMILVGLRIAFGGHRGPLWASEKVAELENRIGTFEATRTALQNLADC
jgi:hypothetical protein